MYDERYRRRNKHTSSSSSRRMLPLYRKVRLTEKRNINNILTPENQTDQESVIVADPEYHDSQQLQNSQALAPCPSSSGYNQCYSQAGVYGQPYTYPETSPGHQQQSGGIVGGGGGGGLGGSRDSHLTQEGSSGNPSFVASMERPDSVDSLSVDYSDQNMERIDLTSLVRDVKKVLVAIRKMDESIKQLQSESNRLHEVNTGIRASMQRVKDSIEQLQADSNSFHIESSDEDLSESKVKMIKAAPPMPPSNRSRRRKKLALVSDKDEEPGEIMAGCIDYSYKELIKKSNFVVNGKVVLYPESAPDCYVPKYAIEVAKLVFTYGERFYGTLSDQARSRHPLKKERIEFFKTCLIKRYSDFYGSYDRGYFEFVKRWPEIFPQINQNFRDFAAKELKKAPNFEYPPFPPTCNPCIVPTCNICKS